MKIPRKIGNWKMAIKTDNYINWFRKDGFGIRVDGWGGRYTEKWVVMRGERAKDSKNAMVAADIIYRNDSKEKCIEYATNFMKNNPE